MIVLVIISALLAAGATALAIQERKQKLKKAPAPIRTNKN
jgi:type II secretory pathway pseudopilin PulG